MNTHTHTHTHTHYTYKIPRTIGYTLIHCFRYVFSIYVATWPASLPLRQALVRCGVTFVSCLKKGILFVKLLFVGNTTYTFNLLQVLNSRNTISMTLNVWVPLPHNWAACPLTRVYILCWVPRRQVLQISSFTSPATDSSTWSGIKKGIKIHFDQNQNQ